MVLANKLTRAQMSKRWRKKVGKAECARRVREYNRRQRLIVLEHYGNRCACCGETQFEFLAIDHKNNDGWKQRRAQRHGVYFMRWIIKNNFPSDLQILCHNCNLAKGFYKVCPHQTEWDRVTLGSPELAQT